MKFIHCADLHLGSPIDHKFDELAAKKRREELRKSFLNLIDKAKELKISHILISGDAFDSDHPSIKDLDYFYGAIAHHPEIFFYYLRGNHDVDGYIPLEHLPNLFLFSKEAWSYYEIGDVTIAGFEIGDDPDYVSKLKLDPNRKNIVMLHGQVGSEINLKELAHKNIHYLALGHIHSYKDTVMEDGCHAVYPGCLEPRGFDEIGAHGFVIFDSESETSSFIPFSIRNIEEIDIDISNSVSEYEIVTKINHEVAKNKDNIYRVNLIGEINAGTEYSVDSLLSQCGHACFFLNIKDKTHKKVKIKEIDLNKPLIQELIKRVRNDESLSEDEQEEAIALALDAMKEGRA